ncbi:MAG: hypothetical protein VX498_05330 [Myxococcota bacterium]|nr:hypothetical protein [Myxococcota bacterium]
MKLLLQSIAAGSLALLLLGCEGGDDDDDLPPPDCPDGELFEATACDEVYCGEPVAQIGTGTSGYEALTDGQEVPIWFGAQGGYHIDITVEMNNFCPIVFLRPSLWLDSGDGSELIEIFDQNRHVQAVRVEPTVSPLQQFWGIRGFVPCEHWPDDPDRELSCGSGAGSEGHLEDFVVEIRMEVEDHNGRLASDTKRVQPVCCND